MGYLRFLLACIVALGHTPGALSTLGTIGALAAVEAFFFISGFYMAATFSTHYTGANRAVRFWLSRFTRLYPLYFAVILLTALVWQVGPHLGWALNWTRTFDYFAKPHGPLVDLAVWSLWLQDLLSLDETAHLNLPVRQAWSVSAELVFYSLTPALVRMRSLLVPLTATLLVLKYAAVQWLGFRYAYFPFLPQMGYYSLGLSVYFFRERLTLDRDIGGLLTIGVAAVMLLLPTADLDRGHLWANVFLIGVLVFTTPTIFASGEGRVSRGLGDFSYGVYLVHLVVIDAFFSAVRPILSGGLTDRLLIPVAILVCTTALAACFEYGIQRHVDEWRKRQFYDHRTEGKKTEMSREVRGATKTPANSGRG